MDDIRIIRLQSGEDIIAEFKENVEEDGVELRNPMTVFFKRSSSGKAMMMLGPWIPFELIKGNSTWIYTQDILTVMTPRENIVSHYQEAVNEMEGYHQEMGSMEELDDDDMGVEEISDEEVMEELEALRKEVKKKLLH